MKPRFFAYPITVVLFVVIDLALLACQPSLNQPLPDHQAAGNVITTEAIATPFFQATGHISTGAQPMTQMIASKGGLTARIRVIDLKPEAPTLTICADLPTAAAWLPRFSATFNGQKVPITGWMLLDPENSASRSKNRCYLASLAPESLGASPFSGELTFSLEYFEIPLPEKITDRLLAKARATLKGSGIEFYLKTVPHGQDLVVTKKPDGLSQDEALQKVQAALELSTDKVYGPWNFKILLSK